MIKAHDRYKYIVKNLKNAGIYHEVDIVSFPKLEVNTKIGNSMESLHTAYYDYYKKETPDIYGNVFSCAYNWLTIIKSAYELGYEHILCMEDDIKITALNMNMFFRNMPYDYDIIRFIFNWSSGYEDNGYEEYMRESGFTSSVYVNGKPAYKAIGMMMFALSRKGMKYFIDYMENNLVPADVPFYEIDTDLYNKLGIKYYLLAAYHEPMGCTSEMDSTIL